MFLVSSCSCLCPIHWSQMSSWERTCSWSSADRQCSNYIWVINNFIAYQGAFYIRDIRVGCCGVTSTNNGPFHYHSGPRFTNGFFIAIQIQWKVRFTLISISIQWSLQTFVHGTTAVLSWHVQKFVALWWPATELQPGEISIEIELRAKNR